MLPSHITYDVAMGRWEPNTRVRLVVAAVDLFAEQGYDATTVSEIAERAGGLTKTTFFRHFPDKREVLFAGQELHARLMADAVAAAPDSATPLEMVGAAVDAVAASFSDDRRAFSARLRTVLAANRELQERAVAKRSALAAAVTGALGQRGVGEPAASLAAGLGVRAFYDGFECWAEPASQRSLPDLAREALDELRAALVTLA
jgi:AcrR family transcriptional regulator